MTTNGRPNNQIFKAILNGVHLRGDGGVLFVKDDMCAYMLIDEFKDEKIRAMLHDLFSEDDDQNFFVLVHKGDSLDVLAYEKHRVCVEATSTPSLPPGYDADPDTPSFADDLPTPTFASSSSSSSSQDRIQEEEEEGGGEGGGEGADESAEDANEEHDPPPPE